MSGHASEGATLELIDLPQDLPGQEEFIGCWLHREPGLSFIVDPGPAATAEVLVEELHARGVREVDFILLTHIHLDHAGGVGQVAPAFPGARVVCHVKGARHLVEPERLWQGSLAVLGHAAEVYGRPAPLAADSIADHDEAAVRGIDIVQTPGHAAHHLSFRRGDTLFAGEAAGTFAELPSGDYLRPATPPRFFLDVAVASIERLLRLEPEPACIAFGHCGRAEGRTRRLLAAARDQHLHWVEGVRSVMAGADGLDERARRCHERFLETDPDYARFTELPPQLQARELAFLAQSLQGMIGYVESLRDRPAKKQ